MRKFILIAFVAIALPSFSSNASTILKGGLTEEIIPELKQDDSNTLYSDMRRRRRRRPHNRRYQRLGSPFAVGASIGTVHYSEATTMAMDVNFDFAIKNAKQEYKAVLGTLFSMSLPVKYEGSYTYWDQSSRTDMFGYTSISLRSMVASLNFRYFVAGQLTSKFSCFVDYGVGYGSMPYKVEYTEGGTTSVLKDNPADLTLIPALGLASNIGTCQFMLSAGAVLTPESMEDDPYEIDVLEWAFIKASIRVPLGR